MFQRYTNLSDKICKTTVKRDLKKSIVTSHVFTDIINLVNLVELFQLIFCRTFSHLSVCDFQEQWLDIKKAEKDNESSAADWCYRISRHTRRGLPLERIILKKQKRESTYLILLTCPRNNTAIFHIKIAFAAGRKMVVRERQLPGEIHFDRFHTLNWCLYVASVER